MSESTDQRLAARVTRRLWSTGLFANALGVIVVFLAVGFLLAVFFDAGERDSLGRRNLPFVIAMVSVLGAILTVLLRRRQRQALGWIAEGRPPSRDEHRMTLLIPAYTATLTWSGWFVGGLASGLYNLEHSLGAAVLTAAAVWLGGETTSAVAYLSAERTMRPLTALALAARAPEQSFAFGVRCRLLFAWSLGTAVPLLAVLAVGLVGISKDGVDTEAVAAACIFLGTVALAVSLLVSMITARAIADPLNAVRHALERVGAGDLGAAVEIDDASEVGLLQAGFNRMAEGLRERERIRDLFGRHVGEDVAQAALSTGTRLGGEEREIGAVFVDLTGSTAMALAMPPTEVVRLLNRFFRVVIDVVESEGGFVNKFEGDAALCIFGAPAPCEDAAGQALCAARLLAERLDREMPDVGYGIGVSAGRAVAGNVGAEHRFEYTVIGDPVNEAARLCDVAKERGESVVASEGALRRAVNGERQEWEVGERTVLKGRLEATSLAAPRGG